MENPGQDQWPSSGTPHARRVGWYPRVPDGDDGVGYGGSGWERPVADLATQLHPGVWLCHVAAAAGQRSLELQAGADL